VDIISFATVDIDYTLLIIQWKAMESLGYCSQENVGNLFSPKRQKTLIISEKVMVFILKGGNSNIYIEYRWYLIIYTFKCLMTAIFYYIIKLIRVDFPCFVLNGTNLASWTNCKMIVDIKIIAVLFQSIDQGSATC